MTETDEAFLVLLFENCYAKWWYKEECKRKNDEVDEKHANLVTGFTDPKGGQMKFGGGLKAGITRFKALQVDIQAGKVEKYRDFL